MTKYIYRTLKRIFEGSGQVLRPDIVILTPKHPAQRRDATVFHRSSRVPLSVGNERHVGQTCPRDCLRNKAVMPNRR